MHVAWMQKELCGSPQWLDIGQILHLVQMKQKIEQTEKCTTLLYSPSASNLDYTNLELLCQLSYLIQVSICFLQCQIMVLENF